MSLVNLLLGLEYPGQGHVFNPGIGCLPCICFTVPVGLFLCACKVPMICVILNVPMCPFIGEEMNSPSCKGSMLHNMCCCCVYDTLQDISGLKPCIPMFDKVSPEPLNLL